MPGLHDTSCSIHSIRRSHSGVADVLQPIISRYVMLHRVPTFSGWRKHSAHLTPSPKVSSPRFDGDEKGAAMGGEPGVPGIRWAPTREGGAPADARAARETRGGLDTRDAGREADEFAEVARANAEAVLRVAAALVGPADAEDAAQEAILRGWLAWGQLRDRAAARPWLLRIAVNLCHDWRRGRFGTHRRRTEPLPDADLRPFAQLGTQPGAGAHAAALDLRRAIDGLDEPLRLVVVLRYFAGLDATEIGAALGAPPATIRTRLRRALALLRDELADSGEWPVLPSRGPIKGSDDAR